MSQSESQDTQPSTAPLEGPANPVRDWFPDDLSRYKAILPGSADRLLAMAAKQLEFDQEMLQRRLDDDYSEARRAQLAASLLVLMGMAACLLTAIKGADWRISVGLGLAGPLLLLVLRSIRHLR